ncbi:ABC transporter ATP-binding protein/permease [bacterium]|nr:ABC transporter ATP-binding protein/permease [bacterium]MCB2201711.1 ABC transporter ATP-binding protein/permease [bacterium]
MGLYRRTFSSLRPYWKQLLIASIGAALYALLSGLLVWMAGPLLTTLFNVDPTSMLSGAAESSSVTETVTQTAQNVVGDVQGGLEGIRETLKSWVESLVMEETRVDTLFRFCVIILIIVVIRNVFYYLQGFFIAYVQQAVVRDFRNRLFSKYQRLSLEYFHKRRTGEIISRVTNDVVVLNQSIDIGFHQLVTDSVMVLVFLSFVIILSWKLTLLAFVVMPIIFGFIWFVGKKMRKYSEKAQRRMADVNSVLEEAVNNTRIVKAFSMEEFEEKRFFKTTYNYFRQLLRMTRIRHLSLPINDFLTTLAGVVILLYAGTQIIQGTGEMSAGDFMTFIIAMFAMIKPVKNLTSIHVKLQEGMAAASRIFRVLDTPETITSIPGARRIEKFTDKIEYRDVSFSYLPQEPVLQKVSFEVRRGEVVAVVGPSGAGKSTLFDLLPRFYDPQAGGIFVDGNDIRDLELSSLRNLMGIVTQETYLFNDTIRHNIAYGQTDISEEKLIHAARMANADRFISQFDQGYDTIVGNRGVRLSGGQRQRIAIARALLKDPEILIFDEATSSLDTESEALVQEAIDRLMTSRTTLVIAHRLSTVKNANRILVLDAGKIVQRGTHEELVAQDGMYQRLYQMQFRNDHEHPVS